MTYTSQRRAADKIAAREDFTGSNFHGRAFPNGCGWQSKGRANVRPPENATYVIWSYATPIAWIDGDGNRVLTRETFSVSTSRHMRGIGWHDELCAVRKQQREEVYALERAARAARAAARQAAKATR